MTDNIALIFGLIADTMAIASIGLFSILLICYFITLGLKRNIKKHIIRFVNSFEVLVHDEKRQISFDNIDGDFDEKEVHFFKLVNSFFPDLLVFKKTKRKHTRVTINDFEDIIGTRAFFQVIKQFRSIKEFKQYIHLDWIIKQTQINKGVLPTISKAIDEFDAEYGYDSTTHYKTDFATYLNWEIKISRGEKLITVITINSNLKIINHKKETDKILSNFSNILDSLKK
ncbi:MAG: hypothetical protein ACRC4M_03580 [Mycoplasma sp.]